MSGKATNKLTPRKKKMMRKRKVFYEFVEVFKVIDFFILISLKVKIVTNKLFKFLSCFFFNNGFFQKINLHSNIICDLDKKCIAS